MLSWLWSKNKEKLILVFDIGSASVGGALFYTSSNGVPRIICSVREPIVLLETVDTEQLLSLTLKSLSVVSEKIASKRMGAPSKIFCVLSSPWYASQTRIIKSEKNTPFVFTSKLADSLIEKEVSVFSAEHLANYVHVGNKMVPIELKNMKMMLNGYNTPEPLNQKAKQLEMTIFISMSEEQFLQSVRDTIHKNFHSDDVKFSSFAMNTFALARDMFVEKEDFVLIDIGGEVTDISLIKKEVLRESISFPIGPNFMIRGIALEMKCSLDQAKSYLSLYKDGHAEVKMAKKLEGVVNSLKTDWLKSFQESLANISNDISIPASIFITVDQDLAEFFSEIIKSEQFSQYTLTESKFEVIFLGVQALHGSATFTEDVTRDSFLIMESIYINRYLS